ncbi:hypothetical protein V8C35DRAFT_220005 [Trichoderma chlorosporum]
MNVLRGTRTSVRSSQLMKVNPSESYSSMLPALEAEPGPLAGHFRLAGLLHTASIRTSIMQPSYAWACAHHSISARHCRFVSPSTASHGHPSPLGEGQRVGGGRPQTASSLFLSGSTGDHSRPRGRSGKKEADGGYPGRLETDFLECFSFSIGVLGVGGGLTQGAPWLMPWLSQ